MTKETKPEKTDGKTEAKVEPKTDAKLEVRSDAKTERVVDVKADKAELKADKGDAKADIKVDKADKGDMKIEKGDAKADKVDMKVEKGDAKADKADKADKKLTETKSNITDKGTLLSGEAKAEPKAVEAKQTEEPLKKGKKAEKETKKESEEDSPKKEIIRYTVQQVHEKYGKGSLMLLGSFSAAPVSSISTGCIGLDIALGVKGLPRGRINEIYGPESSGKTTLALQVIANAQKNGGSAAFVDAEHALDANYCANLGVDVKNLYISQPDSGEQALEIVEMLVTSNAFDVVVIDSVAALVPRAELAGEMGDPHVGLQARLMSQALRKLAGVISKTNTCVIFINQLREKIGVFFGNPETTPGGRALKFYTSVRIEIRKIESIKRGEAMVGSRVRAKVVKNKVAPPFREAEFDIEFGKGVVSHRNLGDEALQYDLLQRAGSTYRYKEQNIADSKERFYDYLEAHPELCEELSEILLRDVPTGKLNKKKKEGKKGQKSDTEIPELAIDPTSEIEKA